MSSFTLFSLSAFGTPAISRGKAILSSVVRDHNKLKCWKIIPISCLAVRRFFAFNSVMLSPSIVIVPAVGSSRRFSKRTNVLFPAPLYPITPNISPVSISNVKSSTALIGRLSIVNVFFKFLIEIKMCPPLFLLFQ